MKIVWILLPCLLVAGAATAIVGSAQNASEQPASAPASGTAPHGIILDVLVTDKSGAPVSGLQPADFKLIDSKHELTPASILETHGLPVPADPPVEAILMLDAVNSDFRSVANERQWLEKLFKASGGELPVPMSLTVLTEQGPTPAASPTRDGNALLGQLDSVITGLRQIKSSTGFWGAAERREISLRALGQMTVAERRPGRKLLIWIGSGWPALSSTNVDTTGITPKQQADLYSTVAEISTALWQSRITLYDIDLSSGSMQERFNYENFVRGADAPKHVDNGDLMLQVLAVQSGGSLLYGNDLPGLILRCIAETKSYYIVRYPMPPAAHANEYHSIEVRVGKPGLKARSRTLYYAQP